MTERSADETTEDIMRATYCALCECGYAGLTMQDIADRSDASKSSLHYHYDTKHELLRSFLDHLYESFADCYDPEADDPLDRLAAIVTEALDESDEEERRDFRTAVLEIKAQSPYEPDFREALAEFDAHITDQLRAAVAEGIEEGIFREDADPEAVAQFIVTVLDGAHVRAISTDRPLASARERLATYVERDLLAPDADREVDFE